MPDVIGKSGIEKVGIMDDFYIWAFRAALGAGTAISIGLSTWALKNVVMLLRAFDMLEVRVKQNREVQRDIELRLKDEIKEVEARQMNQYVDLKSEMRTGFSKMESSVTAIHRRLDEKRKDER